MNVGVYIARYTPEYGGGFTFENDLLQSFMLLAPESHHHFTLFINLPQNVSVNLPPRTDYVDIIPLIRGTSLKARVTGAFSRLWSGRRGVSDLQMAAEKAHIQVIWFTTPAYELVDIPYIATVWDLQHRLQPWFPEVGAEKEWRLREKYISNFLKRASLIISGTNIGKKEISLFYQIPTQRIKIIPHPTPAFALEDKTVDTDIVLKKYNIPSDYIFYPAQFWPHKNHANLLFALKTLRDKYGITLPVVFVGSEKGNLSYIKDLVMQLDLSHHVYFLGFVPIEDLFALYKRAFALTYVTFFGPENLPPLEAFALGCPVIASAVDGSEEQLGNAALLVDPKSSDAIAKSIWSLWENPELRKVFIQRGRARALQWTSKDFVRVVFDMLDNLENIRICW